MMTFTVRFVKLGLHRLGAKIHAHVRPGMKAITISVANQITIFWKLLV